MKPAGSSERVLKTLTIETECALSQLAQAWDQQRKPLCWFDSNRGLPGLREFSVLCQGHQTGFALGRSCRREDASLGCVDRLRAAFERDQKGHPLSPEQQRTSPFLGGWVGYLAYESQIDFDEAFPGRSATLPYPRLWFLRADRGVTVSHTDRTTTLWSWHTDDNEQTFDGWLPLLEHETVGEEVVSPDGWEVKTDSLDEHWYCEAVENILERIAAGEVYQVNLTTPVTVRAGVQPLGLYSKLRRVSPGDYSAFLHWPNLTVLASSPEQFFSIAGEVITVRPMKGTRRRGTTPLLDQQLRNELAHSPKDQAENLMIVDLLRNDLSRIAQTGTVEVPSLFNVEEYSTVFQMTSTVRARLAHREDVFSALGALFPPGSMTGAPKIQATKVISQLEQAPRGIYSGALGLIDWSKNADFNVVIRTLVHHQLGAGWSVGGGIVADSVPTQEYDEALAKLAAISGAVDP